MIPAEMTPKILPKVSIPADGISVTGVGVAVVPGGSVGEGEFWTRIISVGVGVDVGALQQEATDGFCSHAD